MYCNSCSKQIDANADFCKYCGKPQHAGAGLLNSEPLWEVCTLQWSQNKQLTRREIWSGQANFEIAVWADAVGPKGHYVAAKVISTVRMGDAALLWRESVVDTCVQRLLADGWEYAQGEYWSTKFRRRIKV